MIKVNLLNSVTDRSRTVAAVEERVTNPGMQTMLLAAVVFSMVGLGMAYDLFNSRSARQTAQLDLEREQRINAQMALVNKEQADLEMKTKEITARIDVIRKLRESQTGPGAVLRELRDRVEAIPGLYMESVEQKGNELIIKGGSPNEYAITRLGQSMEFTDGMFSNLTLETERKPLDEKSGAKSAAFELEAKPEIYFFTIKCSLNVAGAGAGGQLNAGGAKPAAD